MPAPPILQFGTSRFLQAHADLFVSEALAQGRALGGITVVQSTADPASTARTRAMAGAQGLPIVVRGLAGGRRIDQVVQCTSVREAFRASEDWAPIRERMRGPVRVVLSNTGDSGWALDPADAPGLLREDAAAPASFPAKLLVLLHDRWTAQPDAPLTLLPCELVSRNGDRLRELVAGLAEDWGCGPGFVRWLRERPVWGNSLVDRIVSEPLLPAGAVAEPYALWAIERQPGLTLPCEHPAIVLTDDLTRFERLKLHLLNLGHTVLADGWLRQGLPRDMTVREAMDTPSLRAPLERAWADEVLPVFDAWGLGDEARRYLVELRDRLLNPFLQHRLEDIARHHAEKKQRRVAPLVAFAREHLAGLDQPLLRRTLAPN
jgi:tagaturonate reductase